MSLSPRGSMRHGRHCALRLRAINPARSKTFRCLETAGRLMANGFASSVTEVSPRARRAKMARRVGSASAEKAVLSDNLTIRLNNQLVQYADAKCLSTAMTADRGTAKTSHILAKNSHVLRPA